MAKKVTLTKEEHMQIAKDLRQCKDLLNNLMGRIWKSQGVKGKASTRLSSTLKQLDWLRCEMDDAWFRDTDGELKSPYYSPECEPVTPVF
jgi:hypothetical protein